MSPQRYGQGRPIDQTVWPADGKVRDWLVYCEQIHRKNGFPSLRKLAEALSLKNGGDVGEMLRGLRLPADEAQALRLLTALGATGGEAGQGLLQAVDVMLTLGMDIRANELKCSAEKLAFRTAEPAVRAGMYIVLGEICARSGDADGAVHNAQRAEEAAANLRPVDFRGEVLADVARLLVRAGSYQRAVQLARFADAARPNRATQLYRLSRPNAAVEVVKALLDVGNAVDAAILAASFSDTDRRISACILVAESHNTDSSHARHLIIEALQNGKWIASVRGLCRLEAESLVSVADEYLKLLGTEARQAIT